MADPVVYVEQVIIEVLLDDTYLPTGIPPVVYPITRDYTFGPPADHGV